MLQTCLCVYLAKAKAFLKNLSNYETVYVVLGNETCDLDSAVCSLVYGYTLHRKYGPNQPVLSVFNIEFADFTTKTEVIYYLKMCNVDVANVIFRDDIDLKELQNQGKLKVILVDHHTLRPCDEYLCPSVVEVIDHRPRDLEWTWENAQKVNVQRVGSCATLIAEELMNTDETYISSQIVKLLYGPIVLDTACFSERAGIVTRQDQLIAAKLEKLGGSLIDKKKIFTELRAVKADVSNLTPWQLISKDQKIVGTNNPIPIIVLPIAAKEFLKKDLNEVAFSSYCTGIGAPVAVIIGVALCGELMKRDLVVYSPRCPHHVEQLVRELNECEVLDFQLEPVLMPEIKPDYAVFDIGNMLVTRKQILPIVKKFAQQHIDDV